MNDGVSTKGRVKKREFFCAKTLQCMIHIRHWSIMQAC